MVLNHHPKRLLCAGFLSVLEALRADHSVKACYPDAVTGQSPCWDNTLDGLLVDDCPKASGPLEPACDSLRPRPVYYAYQWYAQSIGQRLESFSASEGCGATMVGQASSSVVTTPGPEEQEHTQLERGHQEREEGELLASMVFGRWTDRHNSSTRDQPNLTAVWIGGDLLASSPSHKVLRATVERQT